MGDGTVYVSNNGESWNWLITANGVRPEADSIAFGNGRFMAVGGFGGRSLVSTNALDWVSVKELQNYSSIALTFFEGSFCVVALPAWGDLSATVLLCSKDAEKWERMELPNRSTLWGISSLQNHLCVVGDNGTILLSGSLDAPPKIRAWESQRLGDGRFAFGLDTPPGATVRIEGSTDLRTWETVQVITNTTTQTQFSEDVTQAKSRRFYRAACD